MVGCRNQGLGCPGVSKGVWNVKSGAGVLQRGCEVSKGVSWGVKRGVGCQKQAVGCRKRAVGCRNRFRALKTGRKRMYNCSYVRFWRKWCGGGCTRVVGCQEGCGMLKRIWSVENGPGVEKTSKRGAGGLSRVVVVQKGWWQVETGCWGLKRTAGLRNRWLRGLNKC